MAQYKRGQHPNSRKNLEKGHRFTEEIATEKGRKGAEQKNVNKKDKLLFREIARSILEKPVSEFAFLAPTAKKHGLPLDITVKEFMVSMYFTNSMKRGGIDDLEKLMRISGEADTTNEDNGILPALLDWMKKDVK